VTRTLDDLVLQVELEGHVAGTPQFERELRAKKVEKCRELRRVLVCSSCPHVEHCQLVREYLRDRAT
jgi:hypothetical protein